MTPNINEAQSNPIQDHVYSPLAQQALIKRGGRFTHLSHSTQKNIKLVKAYEQAMHDLEKGIHGKKKEEIVAAVTDLRAMREASMPSGVLKGIRILELQKSLANKSLNQADKDLICDEIADIFKSAEESYSEMYDLRMTIDGLNIGASPLHKLVYEDVNIETSHAILRSINENFKNTYRDHPEQIKYNYMVYSDIDDTIKASLNDRQSHIAGFYPSALEFFNQLGRTQPKSAEDSSTAELVEEIEIEVEQNEAEQGREHDIEKEEPSSQVRLTFLSARPKAFSKRWNEHTGKKMPDIRFFGLYGTTPAFKQGIGYYILKIITALIDLFPGSGLQRRLKEYCSTKEAQTFISFALDKRQNIDRDLLLRPETRPIMVGDCGEGDLIFLLMKNSGARSPIEDERIPVEYQEADSDTPGNPTNKPLALSFAHSISSHTEYNIRPDPHYREEYAKFLNTHVFDNYVDNALHCLKEGIFDREAADIVVADSRKRMKKDKKELNKLLSTQDKELSEAMVDTHAEQAINRVLAKPNIPFADVTPPGIDNWKVERLIKVFNKHASTDTEITTFLKQIGVDQIEKAADGKVNRRAAAEKLLARMPNDQKITRLLINRENSPFRNLLDQFDPYTDEDLSKFLEANDIKMEETIDGKVDRLLAGEKLLELIPDDERMGKLLAVFAAKNDEEINSLLANNEIQDDKDRLQAAQQLVDRSEVFKTYPPSLQYRLKLIRSVEAYDTHVQSKFYS